MRTALVLALAAAATPPGQLKPLHTYPGLRVPVVTVTVNDPGTAPGYIFLTPRARLGQRSGPMIVDTAGRPVWFHLVGANRTALGLQRQVYRGKPVLTWAQRPPIKAEGDLYNGSSHQLYNVVADDHYRIIKRVRARGRDVRTDMHEFVLTNRGTALVLGFRFIAVNLSRYGGQRDGSIIDQLVQEIDLRTNRVIFSWSAARHVSKRESYVKPPKAGPWDAYHANAIAVDSDGNLLLTLRHTSSVYKVNRRTGKTIWRLGGKRSSFRMGSGTDFYYAHDASRQRDGTITIFDNGATAFDRGRARTSRTIRLDVDTKRHRARLVRTYLHPAGAVLATSQGNVEQLDGGNVFTGWGTSPWWSEHAPDGRLLFAAHLPSQTYQSYRVLKGPWRGRPGGDPALAANLRAGHLTVYAAWNGATELRQWRVLGGGPDGPLEPIGTGAWQGLETKLRFDATPARVQVEALNAMGAVIGRSAAIEPKT